ncbi:MAG: hypothetical protein QMD09_06670 [Desulfatibacillaceae bacterium]|nr:hypothetical protein [Desulfatibacillaceae bacterium]
MPQTQYSRTIYQPLSLRVWEWGRPYARGVLVDGRRSGPWSFWYDSGALQMQGSYENGLKTGLWTKWWENGSKQSEGLFVEGKMHGPWADWLPDGALAQKSFWENGRPSQKTIIYDPESGQEKRRFMPDAASLPAGGYDLVTGQEARFLVRMATKRRLAAPWQALVGKRIGRLLEPWQAALWVILMVVFYAGFTNRGWGILAVPAGFTLAALVCIAFVFALQIHDYYTRPDIGAVHLRS